MFLRQKSTLRRTVRSCSNINQLRQKTLVVSSRGPCVERTWARGVNVARELPAWSLFIEVTELELEVL